MLRPHADMGTWDWGTTKAAHGPATLSERGPPGWGAVGLSLGWTAQGCSQSEALGRLSGGLAVEGGRGRLRVAAAAVRPRGLRRGAERRRRRRGKARRGRGGPLRRPSRPRWLRLRGWRGRGRARGRTCQLRGPRRCRLRTPMTCAYSRPGLTPRPPSVCTPSTTASSGSPLVVLDGMCCCQQHCQTKRAGHVSSLLLAGIACQANDMVQCVHQAHLLGSPLLRFPGCRRGALRLQRPQLLLRLRLPRAQPGSLSITSRVLMRPSEECCRHTSLAGPELSRCALAALNSNLTSGL